MNENKFGERGQIDPRPIYSEKRTNKLNQMKKIIATLSVVWSLAANGQDFVVTLKNDTLRGQAKIMAYDLIDRIQINEMKKKSQFTAIQVRSAFISNQYYQPVRTENGYQMMRLIKPGFLGLYLARRSNSLSYEVQYLVKRDGSSIEVPNLSFKKTMSSFLKDCVIMNEKIEKGELGRRNLDQIVTEYNLCLDNQAKSAIAAAPIALEDPRLVAIVALKGKLESSSLPAQKDALDILNDLREKVRTKQTVPNYLLESLKGLLKDTPDCQSELEKVLSALKGQ